MEPNLPLDAPRHRARLTSLVGCLPLPAGHPVLVLVLRGKLTLEAPDHALTLPAGSVFASDGRHAAVLLCDAAERAEMLCLWPDADDGHAWIAMPHAADSAVATAMQRLADALSRSATRRLAGAALTPWVQDVGDAQHEYDAAIAACRGRTPQRRRDQFARLARVRALLALPDEDPDIAQCARLARQSTWHFVRTFHEVFGETPHQFRSRQRMQCARRLLVQTDLPVSEVMRRVGFASPPVFARAFRQRFGFSATALRNSRAA